MTFCPACAAPSLWAGAQQGQEDSHWPQLRATEVVTQRGGRFRTMLPFLSLGGCVI